MSFDEVQFPTDISYGSVGGPEFLTDIIVTSGGYEKRNIKWANPRCYYEVSHGVKSQQQLTDLINFFVARKGKANGFRFKDWLDYSGAAENIGTGDGSTLIFQLLKNYQSGNQQYVRTINKPVETSEKIYLDGVLQSSGYTIDYTTGIVTFAVAPASAIIITADFEFDVPVRFDTDKFSASMDDYASNSWVNIPLIEVRL